MSGDTLSKLDRAKLLEELMTEAERTVNEVADAVDDADDQPCQEAHQELGQQRVDVNRDQRVQRRNHQEQLRDGEAGLQQGQRHH